MGRTRCVQHPERVSAEVGELTGRLLRQYAKDYSTEINTVINNALLLYFEFSGYSSSGYDVVQQKFAVDNFNLLDKVHPLLIEPPHTLIACTMSTALNRGDLSDDVAQLVQSNEYEQARVQYLGGGNDEL